MLRLKKYNNEPMILADILLMMFGEVDSSCLPTQEKGLYETNNST